MTDHHSESSTDKLTRKIVDADSPKNDAGSRCLLYLYGEMTPEDANIFERELTTSPSLADELVRQSERVTWLLGCPPSDCSPSLMALKTTPSGLEPSSKIRLVPTASARHWHRYASLLAAIASGLVMVVALTKGAPLTTPSEDLKIAQTWAASVTTWVQVPPSRDDIEAETMESDIPSSTDATNSPVMSASGPFGDEAVPTWMFAAVDSSSDLLNTILDDEHAARQKFGSENL